MSSPIIIITPPPPPTHGAVSPEAFIPEGMTKSEVIKLLRDAANSLEKST